MEAHAKFAVLWHLTRDLHINKSSSFGRTFDRLVMASMIQWKTEEKLFNYVIVAAYSVQNLGKYILHSGIRPPS